MSESANPVQEAFDVAHLRHHGLRAHRPCPAANCSLCADNRALALAVAEAAACDCDGSHETNCPWLEQGVRIRAVCAQIEAVGR